MARTPANINQIWDDIKQSGAAYANRYEVDIPFPRVFNDPRFQKDTIQRKITVRCDSVSVPGRSLSTTPFRFYGPARNMPYEQIYSGEMNLSVILSEDLREREFFESWMNLVSNPIDYKFSFYDEYRTDINISILNRTDYNTYSIFVLEAYPKAISDIQVGYDKDNEVLRQEVTLCFRKYIPAYIGMPPSNSALNDLIGADIANQLNQDPSVSIQPTVAIPEDRRNNPSYYDSSGKIIPIFGQESGRARFAQPPQKTT